MSDYFVNLPTELLIGILQNLPVKSIIRFTAVCKSWRSIITSAPFIDSHLLNGKNQILLHSCDDEHYSLLKLTEDGSFGVNSSSKLEFPFESHIGYFRIVGSCDGLVCLWDEFWKIASLPIIIWNPSVRNHALLPKPTINPKQPHNVVLGFGVANNHVYKVVRLVYCKEISYINFSVPPLVEVFSLNTWSWPSVIMGVDVKLLALKTRHCRAFLNGFVYWLAYELIDDNNSSRSSILAFDMGDEVFGEVILPDELESECVTKLCIFLIGESLGAIRYDKDTSCDVWVMNEYSVKESWTKLYTIDLLVGIEEVVGFWKSGEAILA